MRMKNLILVLFSAFIGATLALMSYDALKPIPKDIQLESSSIPIVQTANYLSAAEPFNFTTASSIATPAVVHVNTTYTSSNIQAQELYGKDLFEYFI